MGGRRGGENLLHVQALTGSYTQKGQLIFGSVVTMKMAGQLYCLLFYKILL